MSARLGIGLGLVVIFTSVASIATSINKISKHNQAGTSTEFVSGESDLENHTSFQPVGAE